MTNVLSNPAANAADAAAAYTRAILDALGERDPFDVLTETPTALRALVDGLSDEQIRRPEREGKWSMLNVLEHLADSELVTATRIRYAVAADGAPVVPYDQDEWVRKLWRNPSLDDVLEQHRAARAINLRFWRGLSAEEMRRGIQHAERGRETVETMLRLTAGHDLVHRRQIERIRSGIH